MGTVGFGSQGIYSQAACGAALELAQTACGAMSPKITTWRGNVKSVSLPRLPSCEAVGWVKTATPREALDSFLLEAAASQPVPRRIPGYFGAAELQRSRAAPSCHCVALFGLGRAGTGAAAAAAAAPVLAAPLPHIPCRPEGNSSAPRGRVPAFVCHFGEMRLNVSLPLQSLPCQLQLLERQMQAVFCVGPDSCALQVAEASALWQLFLGQRRAFCRAEWVSSDASSR